MIPKSGKLILLRHGQSEWNKNNLFTGWVDIPLSPEGVQEAIDAGKKLINFSFDVIFVSDLIRAQMTAFLALLYHPQKAVPFIVHSGDPLHPVEWYAIHGNVPMIPVYVAWELNERMYGELQGLNKDETRKKFGEDQVHIWRRSYAVAPPNGESLEMTAARTLPYFRKVIVPLLAQGKTVLISAHGNSLRSIIMELDTLSKEEVVNLEVPTGKPLCYTYTDGTWQCITLTP